jgi:hypothetical protein
MPLVAEAGGSDGEEDVRRDRHLRDLQAGRSKNEIAGSPGLSRNTLRLGGALEGVPSTRRSESRWRARRTFWGCGSALAGRAPSSG